MKKIAWLILVVIFFGILQFFGGSRPEVSEPTPADLFQSAQVPKEVASLLRNSCYDCHSNETKYPWYAGVAPVSWLVYRDVREGRKELNFSVWSALRLSQKAKMLTKIEREVSEGEMPMFIYPLMHGHARLSQADRKLISNWTESYGESLFSE